MKKNILLISCLILSYTSVFGLSENWSSYRNATLDYFSSTVEINTVADLAQIAYLVNSGTTLSGKTIVLKSNLDLTDHYWTPIGSSSTYYLDADFNGNGKTITGLYITTTSNYQGLFGYTKGKIKNLSVVSGIISGGSYTAALAGYCNDSIVNCSNNAAVIGVGYVGGLVGKNDYGVVYNCCNTKPVQGTSSYVGGIAGYSLGNILDSYNTATITSSASSLGGISGYNFGLIQECYNTGAVSASGWAGGIVGTNTKKINSCYNTGSVTIQDDYAGGIAGDVESGGTISNCYNRGTIKSTNSYVIGGLAGQNYYGAVQYSYNTGTISVSAYASYVGAVVGKNDGGTLNCCYYDKQTCSNYKGINNADVSYQAEGLTTSSIKSTSLFSYLNFSSNGTYWKADYATNINDGYHILLWQKDPTATEIKNTTQNTTLQLYPNPAKNQVTVSGLAGKYTLTIYGLNGNLLLTQSLYSTQTLDISALSKGLYIVSIQTENGEKLQTKLVVGN